MTFFRKLRFNYFLGDASTHVGQTGDVFFDPTTTTLRISDGQTAGGNTLSGGSALPVVTISYSDESQFANDSVGTISDSGINSFAPGAGDVLYSVTSGSTVSASGVMVFSVGVFSNALGLSATGANGVRFSNGDDATPFFAMAWATNDAGTGYSAPAFGTSRVMCLAAGTMISLSDGTYKPIEEISYADDLLVWDFDHGLYASAKPLWIKQESAAPSYNVLTFDDGTTLHTVGQHRIFNQEAGCFSYPIDTPMETSSFNECGRFIRLIDKQVVHQPVDSFNIITDYHLNLFANGVLTSCSFNNMYPIVGMRFVKESRLPRSFAGIPDKFYHGMRLAEQTRDAAEIERYIARMMRSEVETLTRAA